MTTQPRPAAPRRRRRWLLPALAGLVLLAGAAAGAVVRGRDDAPPPVDPAIQRAVGAIAVSFTEGDGGWFFPPGYGRCVGAQTVEATGVEALVDSGYLTSDLSRAQPPDEVRTMSEGVATAWADARVECQDWDVTGELLADGPYTFSDHGIADYVDCMRGIGDEARRTALRQQATGRAGPAVADYRAEVTGCRTRLG